MKILHTKITLPFYAMVILWTLILMASVSVLIEILLLIIEQVTGSKSFSPPIAITAIIAYTVVIFIWKISTVTRRDLVWFLRREGVEVKKRNPIFVLLTMWYWSYPQGRFGNSYVVAKIFGAYHLPILLDMNDKYLNRAEMTSENILKDRIDLISSIDIPFKLNEEIRIYKSERRIPKTPLYDLNAMLTNTLNEVSDFRARLVAEDNYFKLTIILSPWLGGRYEKNVVTGFTLFKRLDETLRQKYPNRALLDIETQ